MPADAGMTLKIDQIFFKFGTKRCVFDVVNLALEAFFLAVDDHTASACAQMRMIVHPKKISSTQSCLEVTPKKPPMMVPPYDSKK